MRGWFLFTGGLNEEVAPILVSGDGTVTGETYLQTEDLDGGFAILDLPSREDAVRWAAKIAVACRCPQEVREFMYDPEL
jgi:hypothetical protein